MNSLRKQTSVVNVISATIKTGNSSYPFCQNHDMTVAAPFPPSLIRNRAMAPLDPGVPHLVDVLDIVSTGDCIVYVSL